MLQTEFIMGKEGECLFVIASEKAKGFKVKFQEMLGGGALN